MKDAIHAKKTVAIDAKVFAKKNIGSLGYILIEVINRLQNYDLLMLSDNELPKQYVPSNAKVIIRGEKYTGGADLYRYQHWMKKVKKLCYRGFFYLDNMARIFLVLMQMFFMILRNLVILKN